MLNRENLVQGKIYFCVAIRIVNQSIYLLDLFSIETICISSADIMRPPIYPRAGRFKRSKLKMFDFLI